MVSQFKYLVLANWLFFAIFCYVAIIFVVGCFWLFRAPEGPTLVDRRVLGGIVSVFALNLIQSVVGIVFFIIKDGTKIINTVAEVGFVVTREHHIIFGSIFGISALLVAILVIAIFVFGNLLAVRFSRDSLCIFGTQISYFSIVGFEENKKNKTFTLDYVYKSKHDRIWKERIVFWSSFPVTQFIKKEAPNFFDVAANKTFFEREKAVSKMKKSASTPIIETVPFEEESKKTPARSSSAAKKKIAVKKIAVKKISAKKIVAKTDKNKKKSSPKKTDSRKNE